ncbi:MAG: glyoxalase [Bradyrhizobium sp.]|nr:glyoxalase [Bradyrhizobium sp.]
MTSSTPSGVLTAILPCNNLDTSERFYNRLGFTRPDSEKPPPGGEDTYRRLSNGKGGYLHLTDAVEGWLMPGRNPFGLYLYLEDVDALAVEFRDEILKKSRPEPEDKPWGMYEFALSDPDETLVRVGWPTRLRFSGADRSTGAGQRRVP